MPSRRGSSVSMTWRTCILLTAATVLSACAGPASGPQRSGASPGVAPATRPKSLTIGVTGAVPAMAIAGTSSPVGGWVAMAEIYSDGLVTTDVNNPRPLGRLAERVPSLDDGSISLLPD